MLTLSQALHDARSRGLDRLDAQMLLLHALGKATHDRAWLLAHDTEVLSGAAQSTFEACLQRRCSGEPLAYITGYKEFFGLSLAVDARVLVPRPDTETLVEWALEVLQKPDERVGPADVLELGTGSGAIALALKAARPDLHVQALDASAAALAVARSNAQRLRLDVRFRHDSWFDGVTGRFHLILSNPPYIAAHDAHLEALQHEPLQALVAGADGLDDIRHIIASAPAHLQPGGWLLLEHGHDQAAAVRHLMTQAGFVEVQSRRDLSGIERCGAGKTR